MKLARKHFSSESQKGSSLKQHPSDQPLACITVCQHQNILATLFELDGHFQAKTKNVNFCTQEPGGRGSERSVFVFHFHVIQHLSLSRDEKLHKMQFYCTICKLKTSGAVKSAPAGIE